jgi:hypothetical protein
MLRLVLPASLILLVAFSAPTIPGADKETDGGIVIDKEKRLIIIDAKVAPRKIDDPRFKEIYPIEVVACWPFPRGQKAHETVVIFDAKPSQIHKALVDLGLKPGKPEFGDSKDAPSGPEVKIFIEFKVGEDEAKRVPIEKTLFIPKLNKNLDKLKWRFTGSVMTKPDPNKDEMVYGADVTGTLISIFPVTNQTVFQTNLTMKDEGIIKIETDARVLPKVGTPVKLIIEVPKGS